MAEARYEPATPLFCSCFALTEWFDRAHARISRALQKRCRRPTLASSLRTLPPHSKLGPRKDPTLLVSAQSVRVDKVCGRRVTDEGWGQSVSTKCLLPSRGPNTLRPYTSSLPLVELHGRAPVQGGFRICRTIETLPRAPPGRESSLKHTPTSGDRDRGSREDPRGPGSDRSGIDHANNHARPHRRSISNSSEDPHRCTRRGYPHGRQI